jgi:hypothetical protein
MSTKDLIKMSTKGLIKGPTNKDLTKGPTNKDLTKRLIKGLIKGPTKDLTKGPIKDLTIRQTVLHATNPRQTFIINKLIKFNH